MTKQNAIKKPNNMKEGNDIRFAYFEQLGRARKQARLLTIGIKKAGWKGASSEVQWSDVSSLKAVAELMTLVVNLLGV